jgi:hypothetical protein
MCLFKGLLEEPSNGMHYFINRIAASLASTNIVIMRISFGVVALRFGNIVNFCTVKRAGRMLQWSERRRSGMLSLPKMLESD